MYASLAVMESSFEVARSGHAPDRIYIRTDSVHIGLSEEEARALIAGLEAALQAAG